MGKSQSTNIPDGSIILPMGTTYPSQKVNSKGIYTMFTKVPVQSAASYNTWSKRIQPIDTQKSTVLLPINHSFKGKGFCSQAGQATCQYPLYNYDLAKQIKKRSLKGQHFKQEQIFYIVFNLLDAASDYQKVNGRVGDIRPQSVLMESKGFMKIVGLDTYPQAMSSYQKIQHNQICFLSPQQLIAARQKRLTTGVNNSVAQCYSIGMMSLQLMTMRDCQQLYQMKQFTVNAQRQKSFLNQAQRSGYSPLLINMTKLMLSNQNQRPSCGQLLEMLLPYQDQILSQQTFRIDQVKANISINQYRQRMSKLQHFKSYALMNRPTVFGPARQQSYQINVGPASLNQDIMRTYLPPNPSSNQNLQVPLQSTHTISMYQPQSNQYKPQNLKHMGSYVQPQSQRNSLVPIRSTKAVPYSSSIAYQ